MPRQQLLDTFLPNEFTYTIVEQNDQADICISSIQLSDKSLLRINEVNIMICIENCSKWPFYSHYNKYGNYGDDMIDIFIYNHISSIYKNNNKCITIPTIYMRINHYNLIKNYYYSLSQLNCPFTSKKFCLVINKSGLNNDINKLADILKQYGQVDYLSMYNDKIVNASCYNSIQLLEVFSLYKFIICFENSYNDGYITEKIFNCFLANTIPIYSGSPIVHNFLNTDSFINIPPNTLDTFDSSIIEKLKNNETLYNNMIHMNKISPNYNDENYKKNLINIIQNKINKMKLFDWQYYLDQYPDLRMNGVYTEQQALHHWIYYGEKEGRNCAVSIITPSLFDWQYYLDYYPDLRINGVYTEQQALQHWNDYGEKEGRIYTSDIVPKISEA
jgi:hypothetical protein